MITIFNSKTVYLGDDTKRFNEMRDYLESHKIKYKYKIHDRNTDFTGNGTVRAFTGSFGSDNTPNYFYEILVTSKDAKEYNL